MSYVSNPHNQQSLRTRRFKGYLQFQETGNTSSNNYYRLKERQNLTVNFNFLRSEHYSDDGVKVLDPNGYRHTFSVTLKMTSDMFASAYGTGQSASNTLSYWIYKSAANGTNIADLNPVEIIFIATYEALSGPSGFTTQKYIHWKFVLDPQTFSFSTNVNSGTDEVTISGEVISIQEIKRSATNTPT
jgi:hypothetical protein